MNGRKDGAHVNTLMELAKKLLTHLPRKPVTVHQFSVAFPFVLP
jgi:hypothetical protein